MKRRHCAATGVATQPLWLAASFLLSLAVSLAPATSNAATTLILNESPAYQCYQAALRRNDDHGLDDCDVALESQGLNRVDRASTYSNRALLLARGGDLKAALKDHQQAVRLAPELASVLINRANLYVRLRQFSEALTDLDAAAQIDDPARHLAFYNRALLHQRLGNAAAAREDAEQAVRYGPDVEAYGDYLKSLNQPEPVTATPQRPRSLPERAP